MLPKKRKNKKSIIKRFLNKIILLIIIVFFVLFFIYNRGINSSVGLDEEKEFIIESGDSVELIAEKLREEKLIKSKSIFKIYAKLSGNQSSFRNGSYQLNFNMNIKEITAELTKKIFLKPEERLTFIEGWNLKDYTKLLLEKNIANSEEFLKLSKNFSNQEKYLFLNSKPINQGLEGYLFPDTYRFFTDVSTEEVIEKMLSNFDKKLTIKMREDILSQGKTIHEIITMASIIEKEVRSEKDMKIVSGIFWNRIKNKQALESCATLAYILGVNKPQYSYEDTRIESPYNTYINRGLPPGPIANPGIKAIESAIYPENTKYNYFLTDLETGKTIFSETYNEHLINKNKHIK